MKIQLSGGQLNVNPDGSLGGIMSDTELVGGLLQNLFDAIDRNEVLLTITDYRMVYILNDDPVKTVRGIQIWIEPYPILTVVEFGLDSVGKGDGRTFGVAQTIPSEDTAPTGVSFFGEKDGFPRLPLPALRPNEAIGVWLKRTTEKGQGGTLTVRIRVEGDDEGFPTDEGADGISIGEIVNVEKNPSAKIGEAKIGFFEIN